MLTPHPKLNHQMSEAPFSVTDNGESVSTLSGSLSASLTDMTLPGRNGMSFSLTRQYDTNAAQYYDMKYGYAGYSYPINYYYVVYNEVMKPILYKYDVKYKESYYIENDYSSDGTVDYSTAFVESYTRRKGSYNNREDAEISKNQSLTSTPLNKLRLVLCPLVFI